MDEKGDTDDDTFDELLDKIANWVGKNAELSKCYATNEEILPKKFLTFCRAEDLDESDFQNFTCHWGQNLSQPSDILKVPVDWNLYNRDLTDQNPDK